MTRHRSSMTSGNNGEADILENNYNVMLYVLSQIRGECSVVMAERAMNERIIHTK